MNLGNRIKELINMFVIGCIVLVINVISFISNFINVFRGKSVSDRLSSFMASIVNILSIILIFNVLGII